MIENKYYLKWGNGFGVGGGAGGGCWEKRI